jgi:fluoroacetyl-CoA thioesterase
MEIGLRGTATVRVTAQNTAETLGSGDVPVFATPSLVALLETAAVNAVTSYLSPGETTVGTWIEVTHLAGTPVGMEVRAEATLSAVEGRRLTFSVVAHDAREKVGEGRHQRIVVARERFLAKVADKR